MRLIATAMCMVY